MARKARPAVSTDDTESESPTGEQAHADGGNSGDRLVGRPVAVDATGYRGLLEACANAKERTISRIAEAVASKMSIAHQAAGEEPPGNWRPRNQDEVSTELSRLRELANRARHNTQSLKRIAAGWLRPSPNELAPLTRWYNGKAEIDPKGTLTADLRDAVAFLGSIAAGTNEADASGTAARLEYFADLLEGKLRHWVDTYWDGSEDWEPGSTVEADDLPVPLQCVVRFRLYGDQYVRMVGIRMNSPNPFLKLRESLQSLAENVAQAIVASGEDAKPLFRLLHAAEHCQTQAFAKLWSADVLPMLRTTETKLKATPPTPQGGAAGKSSEAVASEGDTNEAGLPALPEIELDRDYKLISELKNELLPDGMVVTDKQLGKFLDKRPDIRQANPIKGGKPWRQRRYVSIADFVRNLNELKGWLATGEGESAEHEKRRQAIAKAKENKKQK